MKSCRECAEWTKGLDKTLGELESVTPPSKMPKKLHDKLMNEFKGSKKENR